MGDDQTGTVLFFQFFQEAADSLFQGLHTFPFGDAAVLRIVPEIVLLPLLFGIKLVMGLSLQNTQGDFH